MRLLTASTSLFEKTIGLGYTRFRMLVAGCFQMQFWPDRVPALYNWVNAHTGVPGKNCQFF
ncbi:MAG TPA: hypothetical protein DCQ26_13755 [Marinilabiliales bacterium]|nr:MAG: hypothetical protein A2W95_08165 [Bacteroidetes bacterium GWA2_40_14]OFX71640.1 MAG: hypothetical protein A2W96_09690 [Bacteroidetes bacterium GWD2_40_43]OFX90179.1 MAG: hypothetical protein A2W97_16875 [Bacteroidetes bacterium GWE2_40_63]OFY18674.1 MAG: hypothetical protein A2W88_05390 [Bacteroidetes bacterium GWF2_40_13]OFZ27644.1 MAG: hypothetical protein A2437_01600 [Bacteroidetes bacterium RIFOXYC2_FULL_40_12]HAM99667.1 hypothetical protein [Marinilabiliales bacterium]